MQCHRIDDFSPNYMRKKAATHFNKEEERKKKRVDKQTDAPMTSTKHYGWLRKRMRNGDNDGGKRSKWIQLEKMM